MNPTNRIQHRIILSALILAAALFAPAVQALPFVTRTVTPLGGGIFQFDFSIFNSGPEDILVLTFTDAPIADVLNPLGDPLITPNLVTPVGFLASYDSGLGYVDFLADSDIFGAGTTKNGFSLESSADGSANFKVFEALYAPSPVPDNGSTLLMATLGLMTLALARKTLLNPQH